MRLVQVNLTNFRNFGCRQFSFDPQTTLIVGDNARGKTNLLEAIYFLTKGTGFREKREEELISFDQDRAIVEGNFIEKGVKKLTQIELIKGTMTSGKKFFINKLEKRHYPYLKEQVQAILFSPEQLFILTGAPDRRRKYLDQIISFYDLEYKKRLINYLNAIRKRNRILEKGGGRFLDEELTFWNQYLINQANYISKKREEYFTFLNKHNTIDGRSFKVEYLRNSFSLKRLVKTREEERRFRKTLIGPQKDDFIIYLRKNNRFNNIRLYGSRSEQRLVFFWLKANEVWYFEERENKKPIILFDDIFSELDEKNRQIILKFIRSYQTVITATKNTFSRSLPKGGKVIEL